MEPLLGLFIFFASCASTTASENIYCELQHRNAYPGDSYGTAAGKADGCPYGSLPGNCGYSEVRISKRRCMQLCDAEAECQCVTWGRQEDTTYNNQGNCWFRQFCNASAIHLGPHAAAYDVYVRSNGNTLCDSGKPFDSAKNATDWISENPSIFICSSIAAALLLSFCIFFVPWGYMYRRSCKSEKPQGRKRLATLAGKIWKRRTFVDPAYAAISYEQLLEMRQQAREKLGQQYATATMHDINRHIIQPACETHGKCYAHILNGHDLKFLQVFVSHSWAENFEEFVMAVEGAFANWPVKPSLWICATALMQSSDMSKVALQVGTGTDPSKAPFTRALAKAKKLLIVRNTTLDIYSRIWCCWELFIAHKQGLIQKPGAVMICGPSCRSQSRSVDIENAHASNAEDKRCILDHIRKQEAGYERINTVLATIKFFKATGTVGQEPQESSCQDEHLHLQQNNVGMAEVRMEEGHLTISV
eukprot:TRINITY_DN3697_c0_g1_i1.p1 TRINITY_DN3697_c0_g1~~TRINITY_DN3697_c0_g1_i1.p1  ORF type:complete len:490 (+),score=78.36 TRINITY_DN3697_c0_g1_i1:48-1472(+)